MRYVRRLQRRIPAKEVKLFKQETPPVSVSSGPHAGTHRLFVFITAYLTPEELAVFNKGEIRVILEGTEAASRSRGGRLPDRPAIRAKI